MKSLIQELQEKCVDKTVSISEFLIFALLVARKLKLYDFAKWINNELNGYNSDKIPAYRIIPCELKSYDGYEWVTIFSPVENFSKISMFESISQLEELSISKREIQVDLPLSIEKNLRMDQERQGFFYRENKRCFSYTYLLGIIDKVKVIIINWSLDLEDAGIIGKDMNFSDEEQTQAKNRTTVNYFFVKNLVSAENGMVQISTHESSQSLTQNTCDPQIIEKLSELVNQIQKKHNLSNLTPNQKSEIEEIFKSLNDELSSSSPKKSLLKNLFIRVKALYKHMPEGLSLILNAIQILDRLV